MKNFLFLLLYFLIGFTTNVNSQKTNEHPEKNLFFSYKGGVELIDRRTINSKTFLNSDGSLTTDFSEVPIHYNKDNYLLTYSNDIELVNSHLFKLGKTNLPIFYNSTSGLTEIQVKDVNETVSYGENSKITFYDSESNQITESFMSPNTDFIRNESVFTQIDLWDNIDRRQKLNYHSTKTDYIIKEKPNHNIEGGYLSFTETYVLPSNWYVGKGDGTETDLGWRGELIIFNETGENMFTFLTPYFYDDSYETQETSTDTAKDGLHSSNKGKEVGTDHFIYGSFEYQFSGDKLKLSTNVSGDWLLSENRVYPITIDPTLVFTIGGANIPSCFWTGVSTVTKTCQITPGSEVIETQTSFTYRAQNGGWMSESYTLIEGNNATYQWFRCATNMGGNCGINPGVQYNDFANGIYPSGEVPITVGITRVWGGTGCNNIYSHIITNTWETSITFIEPIALPVTLTSFISSCSNGTPVLNWSTASEQNSDYFQIERSSDGLNWVVVDRVKANGNSNSNIEYEFTDDISDLNGYYRLKQVDFDGKFEYFGPISINCGNNIRVHPNPVTNKINITGRTNTKNIEITIKHGLNKVLYHNTETISNNLISKEIDLSNLQSGYYTITINQQPFKIIKL